MYLDEEVENCKPKIETLTNGLIIELTDFSNKVNFSKVVRKILHVFHLDPTRTNIENVRYQMKRTKTIVRKSKVLNDRLKQTIFKMEGELNAQKAQIDESMKIEAAKDDLLKNKNSEIEDLKRKLFSIQKQKAGKSSSLSKLQKKQK